VVTSRPLIQSYIGCTTRSDPFGSATRFNGMTAKNLGPSQLATLAQNPSIESFLAQRTIGLERFE
jgi:hypothetical protein